MSITLPTECKCGCGELAPISDVTRKKYGWVRGEPKDYILGHSSRERTPIKGEQKRCSVCQRYKDFDQFGKCVQSASGLKSRCKECRVQEALEYRARLSTEQLDVIRKRKKVKQLRCKKIAHEYFTPFACRDCGNDNPIVLDFDHVRGEKDTEISVLVNSGCESRLLKELPKTEPVCANCHRIRTAARKAGDDLSR